MAHTYCDHCGIGLREEDFASKKAIFDGADIFCAACFAEYREEEERKKRASQAMAITRASRSGRHAAKASGVHRRPGRPTGRTSVRPLARKKQPMTSPVLLLLVAMTVGAAAALAVFYLAEARRVGAPVSVEEPHSAIPAEAPPPPPPQTPQVIRPPQRPAAEPAEAEGHVPRSLFGPGGQHSRPPR